MFYAGFYYIDCHFVIGMPDERFLVSRGFIVGTCVICRLFYFFLLLYCFLICIVCCGRASPQYRYPMRGFRSAFKACRFGYSVFIHFIPAFVIFHSDEPICVNCSLLFLCKESFFLCGFSLVRSFCISSLRCCSYFFCVQFVWSLPYPSSVFCCWCHFRIW